MDNTINVQINTKAFLRTITIISVFTLVLSIPLSSAAAVPQDPNFGDVCRDNEITLTVTCCWYESNESDTIVCQTCDIDLETGDVSKEDCKPPKTMPYKPLTTGESIVPENDWDLEQPPTETNPLIKSGDSVSPNDDGKVLDEQQLNPKSPLTDQRAPPGNIGGLEQLEQTSNFAKKGNSQNSPVPPECPKQGPIPPDCTMKPKF